MICSNCALVVNNLIINDQVNFFEETANNSMTDHIINCCYRMHILYAYIIENIQKNFTEARKKKCFQKCSNEQLSAYIIYNTLKIIDIPRTMKFIASSCGVNTNSIWLCESFDDSIAKPLCVESVIMTVYSQVGLTLQDAKKVCQLREDYKVQNLDRRSFSPLTVSDALIYLYCKNNKKKITLKQLSDLVHVSNVAILRCLKFFRNKR